ncbi:predicted protein [Chaetoceros tenuissimus]|uniref:Uncharacterized protein n=1 Tax=Chaetoceros tenuissimus TaxID=426638 RepID=A0AAD3CM81_9STRA|nr:predicted protein [Chaetoceros tenuissimus]
MIGKNAFLMEKLAKEGNLEMIQYFDSKLCGHFRHFDWDRLFDEAARHDRLNIMKWIFEEMSFETYDVHYIQCTIEAYEHVLEGVKAPAAKADATTTM